MSRTVIVCQNTTCAHQGSAKILHAFQVNVPSGTIVESSSCLGQCGSGPMVRILPDNTWYAHVQPPDVSKIIDQHLNHGRLVTQSLYAPFHKPRRPIGMLIIAFSLAIGFALLLVWIFMTRSTDLLLQRHL